MSIFVTGATGALGKPVVRLLVGAGHQVYALSRSEANTSLIRQLGAEPIVAHLFDRSSLIQALERVRAEAVVHLATKIPPMTRMGKRSAWQENDHIRRDGTRTLVDAALATGVDTFLYPSFYYVYPDRGDQWIDARSTPVQSHPLQQATLDAEAEVELFSREGRHGVVLRLGSLYGPEVPSALDLWNLAHKGLLILPGTGGAYLSSVWADDAAQAIVTALTEVPVGIYDIVDDEPLTREAFTRALAQSAGKQHLWRLPNSITKLLAGATGDMASRSQRVSNRRFQELTGWKPTVSDARQGWSLIAHPRNDTEQLAAPV